MLRLSLVARILFLMVLLAFTLGSLPLHAASGQTTGVQNPYLGMWISAQELAALPTSGTAWNTLLNAANTNPGAPNISDQDSENDVYVLAKALVYARTGEGKYRTEVISQLQQAIGTEASGRTLALARNLVSYVIAADLVNLPAANPSFDQTFRGWLRKTLTENLDGRTLVSTQEDRPNNWGTHAGASRTAVALYLGDRAELERAANVLRGLLGERNVYGSFSYGDLSWQCDPTRPVGINPKGCTKNGISIDGALPEEMRRGGSFQWPPVETGYVWEALQGMTVQAMLLQRAGYPAFSWSDRAILRAVQYLYNTLKWPAEGDDRYLVWLINQAYGASFPTTTPVYNGKNMGWTDWTHGARTSTAPSPTPPPTLAPTKAAPTATPTRQPTATPTAASPVQPTATGLPAATATQPAPPTATPVSNISGGSGGSGTIKSITFENGKIVDATNGADRSKGTVVLSSSSEMAGKYSVNFSNVKDTYLQEDFTGVDDLYLSFLVKIHALPSSGTRLMQIRNGDTTVGNLYLEPDGRLKLRSGSNTVGSPSAPLAANTLYRIGLHQKKGTGSNAVLEAFIAPAGQSFSAPFASLNNGGWTSQATLIRFGATMSAAINAGFDNILLSSQAMP